MPFAIGERLLELTRRRESPKDPPPLLVELFEKPARPPPATYESYPFAYGVMELGSSRFYEAWSLLSSDLTQLVRRAVAEISASLQPEEVDPLTFPRLVEVLTQRASEKIAGPKTGARVVDLAELSAYEAIGLSRVMALAKDDLVTEFFVDSDSSPVYLDHASAGRCETEIMLSERERRAMETHMDTFGGYTADYRTPSLKNELVIAGATLRISLDLEPVSVNRFALDVRRLNISRLSMRNLIEMGVISLEAASLLVGWLEAGGNLTIIGETGTGKTTLLNALDEKVDPRMRRLYIEDAVETRDLIARGYHQMKVKVDPFDRGRESWRTKESEIVKALHRSPDIVILSEIQSEEHSRAFFHSLSAGARGIQTFHASSVEQAISRWLNLHHIPVRSLLDLGIIVQMARPDRMGQERRVYRICAVLDEGGAAKLKELYMRDREGKLIPVGDSSGLVVSPSGERRRLDAKIDSALGRLSAETAGPV